jgi:SAM-dependent methyltransferase
MRGAPPYGQHAAMSTADEVIDADAFNRFEAAGWEARAERYHRHLGAMTAPVIEPLLDAAGVAPGRRVLDVATGPGYAAAACAVRGASVVGVDVAGAMVALARRLRPELDFRQADAEKLPFGDGEFDAVIANFLVPHVGRPERVAAELARVLAPGGRLALSTWDVPSRGRLVGVLADAVHQAGAAPPADLPPGPPLFRFADEAEFSRLLAGAGLEEVEVRTVTYRQRVAGAEQLWEAFLHGAVRIGAMVRGQPEPVRARIRAAFDRLVEEHATDGGVELPVSVKLATGRKP